MTILEIANNIWDTEFGDEHSELARKIEIQAIEEYLKANVGQLNVLLNSTFVATSDFGAEEGSIFSMIYLKDWYRKQARNILRGVGIFSQSSNEQKATNTGGSSNQGKFGDLADDWTSIKEGDTTITRSRPTSSSVGDSTFSSVSNESSRLLKQLAEEADVKLRDLVYKYNLYKSAPIQVAGNDAPA